MFSVGLHEQAVSGLTAVHARKSSAGTWRLPDRGKISGTEKQRAEQRIGFTVKMIQIGGYLKYRFWRLRQNDERRTTIERLEWELHVTIMVGIRRIIAGVMHGHKICQAQGIVLPMVFHEVAEQCRKFKELMRLRGCKEVRG